MLHPSCHSYVEIVGIFMINSRVRKSLVTRTLFITVFRLNLIEIKRQLLIGFKLESRTIAVKVSSWLARG